MINVFEMILKELRERKCAHVDRYPPFYIASIGAHIFNLRNQKAPLWLEAGRIADSRLHIMFVSPPGFSKSFWLEQFMRGAQSLLDGSTIDYVMEGAMTEAGFIGTTRSNKGTIIETPGLAEEHSNAIIGIEEFSALSHLMQTQYSSLLDTALLNALDSGWCYKRLAAGSIKYKTNLTLWCGTQPARFDLSSGLGRRFLFLQLIPTQRDFDLIRSRRREAKGIQYNVHRMDLIKLGLRAKIRAVGDLETLEWSPRIYQLFDRLKIVHYEEALFEKLILGYNVMSKTFDRKLRVDLDETLESMVRQEIYWRDQIRKGSEYAEVLVILRDAGGSLPLKTLRDRLVYFGLDMRQSTELVRSMIALRLLKMKNGVVSL